MDSVLALHPVALGSILGIPKKFLMMLLRFIDGTYKNSGQRLDNVNQTDLEIFSGKLVLQIFYSGSILFIVPFRDAKHYMDT